eukprot:g235.t1
MDFYCEVDGAVSENMEVVSERNDFQDKLSSVEYERRDMFQFDDDDGDCDAMDVCTIPEVTRSVGGEKKSPRLVRKSSRSFSGGSLKSCLKRSKKSGRKKEKNIRFHPDTKSHDGLSPTHALLDEIVWIYFKGMMKNVMDVVKVVQVEKLHLLAKIYPKLTAIMKRCKMKGKTHVLQGGGGHACSVTREIHYSSLVQLRELVRVTHNRLHAGAVIAMKRELGPDQATDFVLEYVERKEAEDAHAKLMRPSVRPNERAPLACF